MQSVTVLNCLKLEIATDLPARARRTLRAMGREDTAAEKAPYTLRIRGTFSGSRPQEYLKADHYVIGENFLEASPRYKFSSWKYRLFWSAPNTLEMEVEGDRFSAWVWPNRIVPQLIHLLTRRCGFYYFHAAGFYNGRAGMMLFAPSGTGKTLTTLHFLCRGGRIYNDDLVVWKDGMLYPTPAELHFWADRYRKMPEALPETLPEFHRRDRRLVRLYALTRLLSLGFVTLGAGLEVESYWPGSTATAAPAGGIIALRKQPEGRKAPPPEPVELLGKLEGDLLFQHLALLRIAEVERLTGIRVLGCDDFFRAYHQVIHHDLAQYDIRCLDVPARYSRTVFDRIHREIMK